MTTMPRGSSPPPLLRTLALLAGLAGFGAPARPAAAQEGARIVAVDVQDNYNTDDATVKLIADVEVGATFTFTRLDEIRRDLISSGLFKDVEVFTSPEPEGVKLTIVAHEKLSWVIGPTFYNQPGNVGGGLGFVESNLLGQNRKLLLYGQIATADSMFLAGYLDPSIGNSPFYWRVDTYLRRVRMTEYAQPTDWLGQPEAVRVSTMNYLNAGVMAGAHLGREVSLDVRTRAAYVFFRDPEWAEACPLARCQDEAPVAPQADGTDVSVETRLVRDGRANWHGITRGWLFKIGYERTLPALSDVDWWLASTQVIWARRHFKEHNLVLKLNGYLGDHMPFQQELTSGGTPGLRGYLGWQFRGDTKLTANVEYSVPLFRLGPFAFRGLGFWDSAFTTWTRNGENPQRDYLPGQLDAGPRLADWRNGVGAGFRVYVKSVVLPLLGVDVGYGLEANDYHVYLALGLVEL